MDQIQSGPVIAKVGPDQDRSCNLLDVIFCILMRFNFFQASYNQETFEVTNVQPGISWFTCKTTL